MVEDSFNGIIHLRVLDYDVYSAHDTIGKVKYNKKDLIVWVTDNLLQLFTILNFAAKKLPSNSTFFLEVFWKVN